MSDILIENHSDSNPVVTIGMPVYNGEKYVRGALDSILSQTYTNFIVITSDNCSTDGTGEICRDYARKDPRVKYVRQNKNEGASFNFKYVFDQSSTEYFMWAACDDLRSSDFLELNIAFLKEHPEYVGSTCPVKFSGGEFNEVSMGDQSLSGEWIQRVNDFFMTWHANGRFYSLFRREAIASWKFWGQNFLGADWTLIIHLIGIGKLNRVSSGWVVLGVDGVSKNSDIFALFRRNPLDWLLPFNRVTFHVLAHLKGGTVRQKWSVVHRLLRLNYWAFVEQFRAMKNKQKSTTYHG